MTISGKVSRWHAVHGISLGTTYSELERINGRSFPISWGSDQGNVVLSWNGGLLETDLKENGVFVWFDDALSNNAARNEMSHSIAVLKATKKKQERCVNQITWKFPYHR